MKIGISQPVLQHALRNAVLTVDPKGYTPLLSCVLIECEDEEKITLRSTDAEMSMSIEVSDVKVFSKGVGRFAVPAKMFLSIVSQIPSKNSEGDTIFIDFYVTGNQLVVETEFTRSTINVIDCEDWPRSPRPINDGFVLPQGVLPRIARYVSFATSNDESRPVLRYVLMEIEDGVMRAVAADGFRLSLYDYDFREGGNKVVPEDGRLLISRRQIDLAHRILGDADVSISLTGVVRDGSDTVTGVLLSAGGVSIAGRTTDDKYPDYKRILPDGYTTYLQSQRDATVRATALAAQYASQSQNMMSIDVKDVSLGYWSISAQAKEIGDGETQLRGVCDGKPISITCNATYFLEALRALDTDRVTIEMTEHDKPLVLNMPGVNGYKHLIMPMTPR
jgi:DNA polymerase-3 subunit beta